MLEQPQYQRFVTDDPGYRERKKKPPGDSRNGHQVSPGATARIGTPLAAA